MKFFIVDVFAREKYSGNQLAVVLVEDHLSKEEMQVIAREFHFSETSFISLEDSHNNIFKVNIFTPNREVPFAGHPTLGTAYIIKNKLLKDTWNEIVLDLPVGRIPVVEQGFEIKRRSILHVSSHLQEGIYDLNVGGRVFMVAEGKLV